MTDWREEDLADATNAAALASQARATFPGLDINHDIDWLRASSAGANMSLLVLSAHKDGKLAGLAPFEVSPASLQIAVGGLTLMTKKVRRYALESNPLVADGLSNGALAECFRALADRLPDDAAVFLRGVPSSSTMHEQLVARTSPLRKLFHVVPHGPSYMRCRIRWDGSFETYLSSLGKVTRKDLKRTLKKAEERLGAHRLVRYTTPSEIDEFLRHAGEIADKTYQSKLLGLGLGKSAGLRANLASAARSGAFLGHILFVDDAPAAFHCGYVHRACFYMVDGGYDPRWSKAQVGIVTFLHVLQDLERHQDKVTVLDYLYGDADYKKRTSNLKAPERHYYLIKRSVSGAFLATAMRATDELSRKVGDVLDKYGVKSAVKRLLRRRRPHEAALPLLYEAAAPATTVAEMVHL
jgi:CelD/BcsL family acetyltransferase involved in cellulose biosynthesis